MFIPPLGTVLTLAEDWTFRVFNESRNATLIEWKQIPSIVPIPNTMNDWYARYYPLGDPNRGSYHRSDWKDPTELFQMVTLPKGTVLKVDRIYIRSGSKKFDSVTFMIPGQRTARRKATRTLTHHSLTDGVTKKDVEETISAKPIRFWAKLDDVNQIVMEDSAN